MSVSLAEFLLARIAEDEAPARLLAVQSKYKWETIASLIVDDYHDRELEAAERHIARHDPARVLAECEAKRQLLASPYDFDSVLRYLALPYADHPDYDEAWRP